LKKSPLIYTVSHLNLEGLRPPVRPGDDGIGLNFPHAVIIEKRTKSYNHQIK